MQQSMHACTVTCRSGWSKVKVIRWSESELKSKGEILCELWHDAFRCCTCAVLYDILLYPEALQVGLYPCPMYIMTRRYSFGFWLLAFASLLLSTPQRTWFLSYLCNAHTDGRALSRSIDRCTTLSICMEYINIINNDRTYWHAVSWYKHQFHCCFQTHSGVPLESVWNSISTSLHCSCPIPTWQHVKHCCNVASPRSNR